MQYIPVYLRMLYLIENALEDDHHSKNYQKTLGSDI